MKIFIFWVLFIVIINGEISDVSEESTTELCGNSTEDSCEAFNNTDSSSTPSAEEVTSAPVVPTKKPKPTTTPKSTTKKPSASSNATTSPLQPNLNCTCDATHGECEVNCCCDVDCSTDQLSVFTHCLPVVAPMDTDHCFPPHILHHNNTDRKTSVTESGLLCVVQQNTVLSTDFTNVPVIKTVAALEKKLGQRKYFSWVNPTPPLPVFDADSLYSNESPIWISDNSTIMQLELPTAIGSTTLCLSKVVPRYLEDTVTSCTRPLRTESECQGSREIPFWVISSPRNFNFTQIQECTEDVCLPVQGFICTNTCSKGKLPTPTLNNASSLCLNVVVSVKYQITHNGSQGIVGVSALYKLQNLSIHTNQFYKKQYQITYQWAEATDKPVLRRSGWPGYESDKPIISGVKTMKKVVYNVSKEDWINIGTAGMTGYCQNRRNLIFRENIFTRCFLNVNGTCKQMQEQIWRQLIKPATNLSSVVVSSFGVPQENYEEAWVPLLITDPPLLPTLTTSVEIIIVYSLVGALTSPQAKIIAAYVKPVFSETICSPNCTTVSVETMVKFIDKTMPAVTKFAQPPVYEIKLPQDFFYPFFSASGRIDYCSFKCFLFVIILILFK